MMRARRLPCIAWLRRRRAKSSLRVAERELVSHWFIYKPTERDRFRQFWLIRKINRLTRVLYSTVKE